MSKAFLASAEGREFLLENYVTRARSTYDIAQELGTYPNAVNRALRKHGLDLRDKRQAQQEALKSGRHEHPTRGKKRSPEERSKISESVAKNWAEMTDEEKENRANRAKQQWESMPEEEQERLRQLGSDGMRKAATEGSKLEHFLLMSLRSLGHQVQFHAEVIALGEKMHVDLLLPDLMVALEVDGPSHHLPIWGKEQLAKTVYSDYRKTGFLNQAGYSVIRVKHLKKSLSEYQKRVIFGKVKDALDNPQLFLELGVED